MKKENINLRLIIEGCLHGNEQSQQRLYAYYYGFGLNIALRYSKNRREAEEIFNDAFLKVFKNLDKYDPQYSFRAWLRRIIANAAIDYFRKYQRNKINFSSNELPIDLGSNEDPFLNINPTDDVLPIVQQLSPAYRMVFNLYVMEEYKHHEIASLLNITVGTSKSNLARAKVKLRELWLQNKSTTKKVNENG